MLQKTVGIVLHSLKYNDTTHIVDIYTQLHGRASFFVPATRAKRSAVKSVLFQPLSVVEFEADFRQSFNTYRIKDVRAYPFKTIPYDPHKSAIALFLSEFLYRALGEDGENAPLFAYLHNSIAWLDECGSNFANFHLVFLMRLSRFLGLYPNLDNYAQGNYFDLLNASFTSVRPSTHPFYTNAEESFRITRLMRMNYDTMHLFGMVRADRARCLTIISDYYRLHIPGFQELKSLAVLRELFD